MKRKSTLVLISIDASYFNICETNKVLRIIIVN